MKKLLVLTLVLGMASLASAALTATVEGSATVGSTFYIVLSGDISTDFGTYEMYDAVEGYGVGVNAGDLTGTAVWVDNGHGYNAAGNLSGLTWWLGYDGLVATFDDTPDVPTDNDPVSGQWLKLQVTGVAVGTMQLVREVDGDYGSYDEVIASVGITDVPEPATLALLGLGGLL